VSLTLSRDHRQPNVRVGDPPADMLEPKHATTDSDHGRVEERKTRLAQLLGRAPMGIQYNEHLEADGAAILAHACKLGLEGIVSKHRDHPYRSGRSMSWLKVKNPAALGVLRVNDDEP
jgi:hypothetical protein